MALADGSGMDTWAWRVAAITGAAALLVITLLPNGIVLDLAWVALALAALAATVLGMRLHPPTDRVPHRLLVAAVAAMVVASVLEGSWLASSLDGPAATVAQLLYLVSFVLLAVAMFRFVKLRMPTGDAEGLIDGGLVAVATAAVLYDTIASPEVVAVYSGTASAALALLPVLMAIVIASIVRVLLAGSHRLPAVWFFLAAAGSSILANVLYISDADSVIDPALRVLFAAAYVLLACGALHPSVARMSEPAPRASSSLAYGRLAVIGGALASLPAAMLGNLETGSSPVPGLAAILCVGLVLWRIARLLRDRERAAAALEHRADREAALSAIGQAAVTASDQADFAGQVTRAIDRALRVTSTLATSDPSTVTIAIPLEATGGALLVDYPDGDTPDEDDLRFARTAAALADGALRRWEVEEQLRHRSLHDHLTGLPNRALVIEHLRVAIERGEDPDALAVLFIDLDGFKQVNDTLGHAAGDELLDEVAHRLQAEVRPSDVVGRLAGDEFVVVSEHASRETATFLARRLLRALAVPFELDLGDATIGASIGVAQAEPGDDPEGLLHRADAAMYHAKNAGKGRITRWPDPTPLSV